MNIHVNYETIVILCNWVDGMNRIVQRMYKRKEEGPRHPLPIAGFTSFCNLITDEYYILFSAKTQ